MKTRLSQLVFVLSQPKVSVHFEILYSVMFFKEAIAMLSFCIVFGEIQLPTYLPTYAILDIEAVYL